MKLRQAKLLLGALLSAAAAVALAGCGSRCDSPPPPVTLPEQLDSYGQPSPECRAYMACYVRMNGVDTSYDSSYPTCGTCWTTTAKVAAQCTDACKSALTAIKTAYPDAGC